MSEPDQEYVHHLASIGDLARLRQVAERLGDEAFRACVGNISFEISPKNAFEKAVEYRHLPVVRYLNQHGFADVAIIGKRKSFFHDSRLPWSLIIGKERIEVLQYIVEDCLADVNDHYVLDETALYFACRAESLVGVQFLLHHHVVVHKANRHGETALMAAMARDNPEIVANLLYVTDAATLEAFNSWGMTALDMAVQYAKLDFVRLLVDSGGARVRQRTIELSTNSRMRQYLQRKYREQLMQVSPSV